MDMEKKRKKKKWKRSTSFSINCSRTNAIMMKMKQPDISPAAEKQEIKETREQKLIRQSFAIEANAERKIAEWKNEIEKMEKSHKNTEYKIMDKRMGENGSDFDPDALISQAEAKIRNLEDIKKQAIKDREDILSPKLKPADTPADIGNHEKQSDLEKAQKDFIESQEIDRLAEEELMNQMEREKEQSQGGLEEEGKALEPDEIIPPGGNLVSEKETYNGIPEASVAVAVASSTRNENPNNPGELVNANDPSSEQKIEFLGKLLEQQRMEYARLDYQMDKNASAFKKIFGLGKRDQFGEFSHQYEQARMRYQDTLKAYVKEISKTQLTNEEDSRILAEFVSKGEMTKLAEARNDIRIGNSPRMEWLKRGSQKIVDRYRKLPLWAKVGMGAGLVVSGAGVGIMTGYRAFGAAASATGYKQMFEGIAQKLQSKKDIKEAEKIVRNSKVEGMGEVQKELLLKNLDSAIQNIDKKIQKKKMWGKFRTWMAVGASAGTIIVGRQVGQYIGEKFGDAAEYLSEKFHGLSDQMSDLSHQLKGVKSSGAGAIMEGMEGFRAEDVQNIDNTSIHPSAAGAYMEGMENVNFEDVSDTEKIPNIVIPDNAQIENAEQLDKLANKPFEDLKNAEITVPNNEAPSSIEINQPENNFQEIKSPEIHSEPMPANDVNNPQEIVEQQSSSHEVSPDEQIPKIDEKTDKRVFVQDGKIEELNDYNPETSPHKFDKIDEIKSENHIKDVIQENQSPSEVEKEVVQPAPEIVPENKISDQISETPQKVEIDPQLAEKAERITSGIDKIISGSDDPNQMMVFLRQEFCSNDIQNWRGICLNSVDSLIAEKSPGSVGEKIAVTIEKLRVDYSLGDSVKPLYGETVEVWTRRVSGIIMESKK
jgi:hypothetical protein